uniref:ATP-dependent DNA helicase n=1 Tax=Amphimedon queenslandica TaxID=400682 RepID=A0A1X7SW86_AMPQE
MSIHKSQGMTLDCVEISLGGVFETGQAYVALSHGKSLKTLRVKGFDPSRVQANKDMLEYYRNIRHIKRATHCGPV